MLSRCTPRWRDMGAAVGGTNHIGYKGWERGSKERRGRRKKFPAALGLGPVCVCLCMTEVSRGSYLCI